MTAIANIQTAAPALWFGNTLITINLSAKDGADGICVVEHRMPYGDSPPLHVHRNEDEVFHILSGTLRFRVDGQDRIAGAGETVLAPKGLPHSYRVESRDGARVLTITRGADFETMLCKAGRPALSADLPPQGAPTPEAIAFLSQACAENGIDIVGGPLA
jgi:quercetin dioxygenase-like cupin family protein